MDWLELHIDTTHTGLEPVETMLSALGIDGVVIDDETEFHDFWSPTGSTGTMWTKTWRPPCTASPG